MKAKKGFTLVEILIVVVILGILAAVVIPQFSDASTSAKTSSLKTDLQTMRSQLQLYKIQHNDTLPTLVNLTIAMTATTDVAGAAASSGTTYGPYMVAIPTNSFNNLATVEASGTAGYNSGWEYNATTGAFISDYDATTAAY